MQGVFVMDFTLDIVLLLQMFHIAQLRGRAVFVGVLAVLDATAKDYVSGLRLGGV
jgi:hypothetical protein